MSLALSEAEKAKALHGKKTGALGDHCFGITNVVARVGKIETAQRNDVCF